MLGPSKELELFGQGESMCLCCWACSVQPWPPAPGGCCTKSEIQGCALQTAKKGSSAVFEFPFNICVPLHPCLSPTDAKVVWSCCLWEGLGTATSVTPPWGRVTSGYSSLRTLLSTRKWKSARKCWKCECCHLKEQKMDVFNGPQLKKITYSVVQRRFFFFLKWQTIKLDSIYHGGISENLILCNNSESWILNLALRDSCLALENVGCLYVAFFGKDLAPKWRWLDIEGVNMAVEQGTGPWLFCSLGTCSESWRPVPFKIKMGKREFTLFFASHSNC